MTTSSLGISSSCLLSAYSSDNLTASRLFPNFSPHCAIPLLLSRATWCLWCLHPFTALPLPCHRQYCHLFALFLLSILFSQFVSIFSVPLPNTHFLFACWFSSLPLSFGKSAFRGMPLYYSQGHSYLSQIFFKSAYQYTVRTCWSLFAHIWLLPFYSLVHEVAFTTERRSPLSCFCGSCQRVLGMLWSNPFPKCQYCYWLHVEFVLFALSFLLLFIVLSFCCTPLASPRCHPSMASPPEPCHIAPSLSPPLFECFFLVSLGFAWCPEARSNTAAAILKHTKEGRAAGLYPRALPYTHFHRHAHTHVSRGANISPADKP